MWKTLDVEDLKQSISDGKKKKRIESYSLHKEPFFVWKGAFYTDMGIVYENTNFHGSETNFLREKRNVTGVQKQQQGYQKKGSTCSSFSLNTCKTAGALERGISSFTDSKISI